MNIEDLRIYCLSKKTATESMPFGDSTLVFKLGTEEKNKMFALLSLDSEDVRINLKCDPERALELREYHPEIIPGYHMSKVHWNTVICSGSLSNSMITDMIDDSYELILHSLPKKIKAEIDAIQEI